MKVRDKSIQKIITIRRRIDIKSDDVKRFILRNIEYRNMLYNMLVDNWCSGKISTFDDIDTFLSNYHHQNEENNLDYINNICMSTRNMTGKEFKLALKTTHTQKGVIHHKNYICNHGSFSIDAKSSSHRSFDGTISLYGNIKIDSKMKLTINASRKNHVQLKLKERLYSYKLVDKDPSKTIYVCDTRSKNSFYMFSHNDIKMATITYHYGKFYIGLVVNATFVNEINRDKSKELCGIDLGIHNNLVIKDRSNVSVISFLNNDWKTNYIFDTKNKNVAEYVINESRLVRKEFIQISEFESIPMIHKKGLAYRYHYLEKRLASLRRILHRKKEGSSNSERIKNKIRICHSKMKNLRRNWINKICFWLTNPIYGYRTIVVDKFVSPLNQESRDGLNIRQIHNYNKKATEAGMYLFYLKLVEDCEKFGCTLIETTSEQTTNTCSICGNKNKNKISLSDRFFRCESSSCSLNSNPIDRDINAAINCYKYGLLNI